MSPDVLLAMSPVAHRQSWSLLSFTRRENRRHAVDRRNISRSLRSPHRGWDTTSLTTGLIIGHVIVDDADSIVRTQVSAGIFRHDDDAFMCTQHDPLAFHGGRVKRAGCVLDQIRI